uniref:RBR-type E3 ubiquitin transferase n=1 Tax=Mycena chlorophos TaxID=658473 RepID=A0ABQ0LRF3_MYCCL|nr:predicted protein [Mycena chlorophos]
MSSKPCELHLRGRCIRGDRCKFSHTAAIEQRRTARSSEASTSSQQRRNSQSSSSQSRLPFHRLPCYAWKDGDCPNGDECFYVHDPQVREERLRRERAEHAQRFESCRIRIKGLPADAHEKEILELFTQQGIDADRLLLVSQKPDEGRLEATVVSTVEEGSAVAIGLQGIEFREEHLDFEICDNATGMGISLSEESDTVTLSWPAPSNTFVATFASQAIAVAKVQSLNRYICGGRRVNAELHGLDGSAVKFSGIPLIISRHTLAEFVGCEVSRLHLLATIAYDANNGLQQVEKEIRLAFRADLHSAAASSPAEGDIEANVTFKARCRSREAAKRLRGLFHQKKFAYLGDQFIHAHLPHLHEATLSISSQQYRAQRRLWDALAGPETPKATAVCILPSSHDQMRILVWGNDKHAVGSLKVRVESVAGGEALPRDLWHRSFAAAVSPFINSILRLAGDPAAIEHARQIVREEVERLNASEWTFYLERQSIQFFVQGGMKTLRQILGEGNVSLDISGRSAKLHVRGGEDAHQVVDWLIAESLENVQPRTTDGAHCPICHDEVVHPVLLGCNHSYCLDCFRHYISTAADALPLNCLGNEATCKVPIALPVIERFLSPAQFQELLETAYMRYIEQHPDEFKYCKTADCAQVYRRQSVRPRAPPPFPVTCPSCFFQVCPACDEQGHEGISCEDRRLQNDPGEQERRNDAWAAQNGIKRFMDADGRLDFAGLFGHFLPAPGYQERAGEQRARQARDDARRRVVVVEPADPDIELVPVWLNEYQAHFEAERRDAVDALRRQAAAEQLRLDQDRRLAEAEAEVAEQRRLRLVEDARRQEEGGWRLFKQAVIPSAFDRQLDPRTPSSFPSSVPRLPERRSTAMWVVAKKFASKHSCRALATSLTVTRKHPTHGCLFGVP